MYKLRQWWLGRFSTEQKAKDTLFAVAGIGTVIAMLLVARVLILIWLQHR